MINEEERKTNRSLRILIGDDELDFLANQFEFERYIAPKLHGAVPNHKVNWNYESSPQRTIEEARTGRYDIVVTDLDYADYGNGSHREGYEVIDAVCIMNPRPLLVLCTSSKDNPEMEQRTKGKIDFRAGGGDSHKLVDLVDKLTEHFQKLKGGNE
jgi:hypothetical protein